jgi:hypothetical protein
VSVNQPSAFTSDTVGDDHDKFREACLTCPVFLTGPEFLPELREQRRRTLTLIDVSKDKGHDRVVEMNQQVLNNLDRMIGEVEQDEHKENAADAG